MKDIPMYQVRDLKNLKQLVNESCEIYKERVAYLVKNEKREYVPIKFEKVKKIIDSLGTALLELGLKGERIAIIGENRFEWAMSYLAIINGVGVVVPLDKQLPLNEIENCIKRANVTTIVYSEKLEEQIKNIKENNKNIKYFIGMDLKENNDNFLSWDKLVSSGEKLLLEGNSEYINSIINEEEMATLVFTSGTTSESKAVMLSQKNICFNIHEQNKMLKVTPDDRFLSLLPMHHMYECVCGFLTPLYMGASVAYCEGLKYIQKNMQEAEVTFVLAVPLVFESIYKKIWTTIEKQGKTRLVKTMIKITNFLDKIGIHIKRKVFKEIYVQLGGNVKVFIAGAAAINIKVSKGFRDFGILAVQGYGLTECAPIVCLNRDVDYKDDACRTSFSEYRSKDS